MRPHDAGRHLYKASLTFEDAVYALTHCSSLPMPCVPQESIRKAFPLNLGGSDTCYFCKKRVYVMERLSAEGHFFHRECFRCSVCATTLPLAAYAFDSDEGNPRGPGQHSSLAWASVPLGALGQPALPREFWCHQESSSGSRDPLLKREAACGEQGS